MVCGCPDRCSKCCILRILGSATRMFPQADSFFGKTIFHSCVYSIPMYFDSSTNRSVTFTFSIPQSSWVIAANPKKLATKKSHHDYSKPMSRAIYSHHPYTKPFQTCCSFNRTCLLFRTLHYLASKAIPTNSLQTLRDTLTARDHTRPWESTCPLAFSSPAPGSNPNQLLPSTSHTTSSHRITKNTIYENRIPFRWFRDIHFTPYMQLVPLTDTRQRM